MKVIIDRDYQVRQTLGSFIVLGFGRVLIHFRSLELPYLDNKKLVSCILPGEYDCIRIKSSKYGICYLIQNVPNRSDILIHIGNFATGTKIDTTGCILVGLEFSDMNADGYLDVKDSTMAMNALRAILPVQFKITIH